MFWALFWYVQCPQVSTLLTKNLNSLVHKSSLSCPQGSTLLFRMLHSLFHKAHPCTRLEYSIPSEHLEQAWQTNKLRHTLGFGFLRNGSLINPRWQQILDFNLGTFIPKQGLDDATADKFAKTKQINKRRQLYNKLTQWNKNKTTYNIQSLNSRISHFSCQSRGHRYKEIIT